MYVYRVENDQGYGPYSGYDDLPHFPHHRNIRTHPTTWNDTIVKDSEAIATSSYEKARHGFMTKGSYERWFSETDRLQLREYGYRLVVYKVPIEYIEVMKKQIRFHIDYAERIDTLAI